MYDECNDALHVNCIIQYVVRGAVFCKMVPKQPSVRPSKRLDSAHFAGGCSAKPINLYGWNGGIVFTVRPPCLVGWSNCENNANNAWYNVKESDGFLCGWSRLTPFFSHLWRIHQLLTSSVILPWDLNPHLSFRPSSRVQKVAGTASHGPSHVIPRFWGAVRWVRTILRLSQHIQSWSHSRLAQETRAGLTGRAHICHSIQL